MDGGVGSSSPGKVRVFPEFSVGISGEVQTLSLFVASFGDSTL